MNHMIAQGYAPSDKNQFFFENDEPETPVIDWEITSELLDWDTEERMKVFTAEGTDQNGKRYAGSAYFFCGELDEIKDIEQI